MRTLVIGDTHGNYQALKQCLERSKFDYEEDKLILLGDLVDGYSQTYEVIEELLKIKNLIFVRGNHDEWFMNFISRGLSPNIWIHQGGANTLKSYNKKVDTLKLESGSVVDDCNEDLSDTIIPVTHQELFNTSILFYEQDDMLFVHGGFDDNKPMHLQNKGVLLWDRGLIDTAKRRLIKGYKEVFVGHTALTHNDYKPVIFNNLYCLDQGAGWEGKLTIMDIHTKEYWQSNKFGGHDKYDNKTRV